MKKVKTPFDKIALLSRERTLLSSIAHVLEWDQETYMPLEGIEWRSQQLEFLTSLIHKKSISPQFEKALKLAIDLNTGSIKGSYSEEQQSALKCWKRDFLKEKKIPTSFAKNFSQLTSKAMMVWREAKKEKNFKLFAPYLDKIVTACRKKADLLGYSDHPYDALLDLFEPDMTTKKLTPLFKSLEEKLTPLSQEIRNRFSPDTKIVEANIPPEVQEKIYLELMKAMGLESGFSRLDLSTHPFCMGIYPKDIRLTYHLHPTDFTMGLFAVLHESGHALYDAHLPLEHYGTPLGESISLGIHESQSRFWETVIGQSRCFSNYFYPKIQEYVQGSSDDFYKAINKVEPSLIRIHADEVTYSLHIILRYDMEKALIEGSLKVKDVPEMWNSLMEKYLKITPKNDAEGCLQDIHWSMGALGYFPDYALGNLYSAHFFKAFKRAHPDWSERVSGGELKFITEWLSENIHKHGRRFSSEELLKRITGAELSVDPYIEYLTEKYQTLYT